MQPIRTERSTFIFRSTAPVAIDMPGERVEPGRIRSVWDMTPRERSAVADGLNIEVEIFGEPFPPISLNITDEGAASSGIGPRLMVDRFMIPDGSWVIRVSDHGAEVCVSREYKHRWSSWLALRALKRAFPTLDVISS